MEPREIDALKREVDRMARLLQRMETALAGDVLSPVGIIQRVNTLEKHQAASDRFRNWLTGGISVATSGAAVGIFLAIFNYNLSKFNQQSPKPTDNETRTSFSDSPHGPVLRPAYPHR